MKEYNWNELELKYFGLEYKILTPQEKAKRMLETMPLESEMKKVTLDGALTLNDEKAIEVYQKLISAAEGLTEFSRVYEEAKQKQWELRKKRESYKK